MNPPLFEHVDFGLNFATLCQGRVKRLTARGVCQGLKLADAATVRGRPLTIIPERHVPLQLPRSEGKKGGKKRRPWTKIP